MSEDDLEEFSVLLARAIQRDYVLFQSVIEEYVAGLTEEKIDLLQQVINKQEAERAKMPYTLDSYNAQCQL
jgi:hypothetical protein|tara:strand:- start:464 stop:676 length:213 start_codon:yes stop_codon:yes gene_type:complete